MSTTYGLDFQVWANSEDQAQKVLEKIEELWNISESEFTSDKENPSGPGNYWVTAYGEQNVSGGMDHEAVEKIYNEIQAVHGEPCKATIYVKYVEQTPYDVFNFGPGHEEEQEDDYCWCGSKIMLTDGCEDGPHSEEEYEEHMRSKE